MNIILKWILIGIVGLVGLFVVALITLPFLINPNDYKDQISSIVQKQTGRVLSIPGDITLQVSPKLDVAFSLGEIQLLSSKDFPDVPFASSKLAEIRFALWPLLSKKRLQINSINLSGVQLNLIRTLNGKTNWGDLDGTKPTEAGQTVESGERSMEKPLKKDLPNIDIGSVNIRDIDVQYRDRQTQKTISVNNFNLNIGHLREDVSFPVAADFKFNLNAKQQTLSGAIQAQLGLTFNLSEQRFNIRGLKLNGLFQGPMVPSSKLEMTLIGDIEMNGLDEKILVKTLSIRQGDLVAETVFSVTGFKTPTIEGTLALARFSPGKYLSQLGFPLPEFSDPQVLNRLSASLGFSLNGDQLDLKEMQIQIDDTTVRANALVRNLQKPAYAVDLQVDHLDLDRYLVKKAEKKAPVIAKKEKHQELSDKQAALPVVHLLKELTFQANVTIDSLKAAKLRMSDIVLKADGKDGLVHLQPFAAKLYDGNITVTGEIDTRQDVPQMRLKKILQNVQLGPMFIDTTGREELSGKADMEVVVVTSGINKSTLVRNANGTLQLSLANGRIARLQILQTIRLAKALLDNKASVDNAPSQPTGFASLTANGILKNGVLRSDDLAAESDLMKVTGKGSIDLVKEQVDYLLTIYLTDRIEREEETGLVNLGNTPIPYRIKGNFTELQQSAAMEELVKSKAKELLLDTLEKQFGTGADDKEKPATDAGTLLNEGLKSLFGN